MPRLLVLCRHPYHLPVEDTEDWLKQELTTVLRRDELDGASLTRLANPSAQWTRAYDWLIEFRFHGLATTVVGHGTACAELLADLRLLGMGSAVALADDRQTIQLHAS
jgi:hypothetical protein